MKLCIKTISIYYRIGKITEVTRTKTQGYMLISQIVLASFNNGILLPSEAILFLKSVIENVCNNIVNYNPYLHHTGQTGVFRMTGPVAYTLAILPLLKYHPHRLERSNHDLNFVYSIYSNDKNYKHRSLFKNHYSTLNEPVTNLSYLSNLLFKLFQPIKDKIILAMKKV